jgi:hypothetical protein
VHGIGEVVELVVSWVVSTALCFVIVIAHERRMSVERLERAWPATSRDAALVAFGVLALPIHFARTLGNFRSVAGVAMIVVGLVVGVLCIVLVSLANLLVLYPVAWAFGLPTD